MYVLVKLLRFSYVLLFVLLIGCSPLAKYDDNEPAAIVKGEKITVGELRLLFPDDQALGYLDWLIKAELVKQEVIKMEIDVSDQIEETSNDWFATLPPADTTDEGGKQIRKFAEQQAKKLSMSPEEFQKAYAENIIKRNVYVSTYIEEMLGESYSLNDTAAVEQFGAAADELIEQLYEKNKDKIKVLID